MYLNKQGTLDKFGVRHRCATSSLVFPFFSCYIYLMEPEIVFVPSAFRHGVTREDILHACRTRIRAGLLEGNGKKYGFIGFNRAGNPIEVFYNPIGENKIKVFHAMGCRNGILDQLEY
jgi:hypothetical protein